MAKRFSSDYVNVRAFGRAGDKGCDGYLTSTGQLYQCYGALNADGTKPTIKYIIDKMGTDFAKAKSNFAGIMKEWHFVHNLVDGLPSEVITKLEELKKANPDIKFGIIGKEGFEERIFELPPVKIGDLLGPAATADDMQNLQPEELRDLITHIVSATSVAPAPAPPIKPVPENKLELNKLSLHWKFLVTSGWQNAHVVDGYFAQHPNPTIGESIAIIFRARYADLKAQNLAPDHIMTALWEFIVGLYAVPPARAVAGQALIAYLFESCDIFEDSLPAGAK